MLKSLFATGLLLALFAGTTLAADAVKSGPQAGEKLPGPFEPLNINGEAAGKENCLYCQYGVAPVAMVFVRDASPEVLALIKKLDVCTDANKACEMGSCVLFCSEVKGLDKKLTAVAKDAKLKHCILGIEKANGPDGYKIAKDAEVTVLIYKDRTVTANMAFKKGEFKEKDIEKIVAEIAKVTKK